MRLFNYTLFLLIFSCTTKEQKNIPTTPKLIKEKTYAVVNYDSCKKIVTAAKLKHTTKWKNLSTNQKQKIFTQLITQHILPSWVGTQWDFNGTTQTPQKGSIACGYFVTTVLQDGGVKLNRVKLAQCASEQMITTLVQPKLIKRFSHLPMQNFITTVNQMGYGLYIVGLDNHTGFIYNDGQKIYFIHSTFVGTKNVQWEEAEKSWVLSSSKYKVLGKISEDEKVLEKWIL
ncbi:MAG: hypothetical protein KA319_10005 [Ferruginibacter sp.]|nr:hypothetical protein [Ferruginibacter sp.]